ncbi:DNA replication and repair protein RecO [Pseudobutyrivibrio sp. ACV-2]|uniref:DNA repair protein RecO n=1 Tax=Pseudobutyrivibrio sp. ACV-2 TaxID=1520801 RepID=UPI000898BBA6|nr:DNA repair protein RecO [Pseudobutyrivibrio sp. ACV-2]SEA65251.1 DNA replication and repair protein RecO [Pseudobutyrivibrio sp. ACV-2]
MGLVTLTGIVLSCSDVGEFDRRLVILTKEAGRVTGFAKGARRPNNPMIAACSPFCFGTFEAFEGRSSYHVTKANITNYFRNLAMDYDKVCLGSYFLEVADYLSVEGADETARLALLYQSLKALESDKFSHRLLKNIYDLKTWVIDGEYPNVFSCMTCGKKENLVAFSVKLHGMLCTDCAKRESGTEISNSTLYTLQFIVSSKIEKLYTFVLNNETEEELTRILAAYRLNYRSHKYKSEEFL